MNRCDNCNKDLTKAEVELADSRCQFIWFCEPCLDLNRDPGRSMQERFDLWHDGFCSSCGEPMRGRAGQEWKCKRCSKKNRGPLWAVAITKVVEVDAVTCIYDEAIELVLSEHIYDTLEEAVEARERLRGEMDEELHITTI